MPSYIGFDERNEKCGKVVVGRLRQYAKSTVFDTKRIIGKKFDDVIIDETWPFILSERAGKLSITIEAYGGMKNISPERVCSILLKHIKKESEDFQGKELMDVVITVPAAFTQAQKKLLAAAFAYFNDRPIPNNSTLLLFDLGGGTLDICVFKIKNDEIEILSEHGNCDLGGNDFDKLLIDYFKSKLKDGHGINEIDKKKYDLMLKSQEIKHNLSVRENDSLDVSDFDTAKNGHILITRKVFETMAAGLLNKIKVLLDSAMINLEDIKKIDRILQVGGGCRMPMIKNLLKVRFPNAELCIEENPDEVVAVGAAYYAYHLFSNEI